MLNIYSSLLDKSNVMEIDGTNNMALFQAVRCTTGYIHVLSKYPSTYILSVLPLPLDRKTHPIKSANPMAAIYHHHHHHQLHANQYYQHANHHHHL
jgi:hypothetical protein